MKTNRNEYQRAYMKAYRAKQRKSQATATHANPMAESGCTGFTDRQLEQLREIVREGLASLLTPLTVSRVDNAQEAMFTVANVSSVNTQEGEFKNVDSEQVNSQKPKLTKANRKPVSNPAPSELTPANVNSVSKVCQQCGKGLDGKRSKARFCSDHCRYSFHGKAKRGKA